MSLDWLVFVPFVGLIGIVWVLFEDKITNLYRKIQNWINTPIK